MSGAGLWVTKIQRSDGRRIARAIRSGAPALLFGLRLWVAVCLALYIAFRLELDNAYWAGASAAIVCQPSLGASLRKGWFRMVGTIIGALVIVLLSAIFPQNRVGFLIGLALWSGACALMATLLRNYAAYGAALAGITAAIIASDELGAVGGTNGQAFTFAVIRTSEICIGIVCAGIVLAATDFGGARRRLTTLFAAIAAETMGRIAGSLLLAGHNLPDTRSARRELIRRVVALDPVIDQTFGESSGLRYHSPIFKTAVDGLFAALASWRIIVTHLAQLPDSQAQADADVILHMFPKTLRVTPLQGEPTKWLTDPSNLRRACANAAQALSALPTQSPSLRLLADQVSESLVGISHTLDALGLLIDDRSRPTLLHSSSSRRRVPDFLPAVTNAARAFVTTAVVELVWTTTAWPNGAQAIAFAAIVVILFSPRADQAYAAAVSFMVGISLTTALAAIICFAVLPDLKSFAAFSVALGVVLVPVGALMVRTAPAAMFMATTVYFVPLLAPTNQMSYDPQKFYNASLAIFAGVGIAVLAFCLLPPLPPALQTRRLLALTVRDLRRLTTAPAPPTEDNWRSLIYSRLSVLPEQAEPRQRSQLLAALSVGVEIVRVRRVVQLFDSWHGLDAALDAVAEGQSDVAIERLACADQLLAAQPFANPGHRIRLRVRASILALSEVLARHAAYFDMGSRK